MRLCSSLFSLRAGVGCCFSVPASTALQKIVFKKFLDGYQHRLLALLCEGIFLAHDVSISRIVKIPPLWGRIFCHSGVSCAWSFSCFRCPRPDKPVQNTNTICQPEVHCQSVCPLKLILIFFTGKGFTGFFGVWIKIHIYFNHTINHVIYTCQSSLTFI